MRFIARARLSREIVFRGIPPALLEDGDIVSGAMVFTHRSLLGAAVDS